MGDWATMAQPEVIMRRTLIPAVGIPSGSEVREDGVRPAATAFSGKAESSVALIMTVTVIYTLSARGSRRGVAARTGSGVRASHRQVAIM